MYIIEGMWGYTLVHTSAYCPVLELDTTYLTYTHSLEKLQKSWHKPIFLCQKCPKEKRYNTVVQCPVCQQMNYYVGTYDAEKQNQIIGDMKIFGCEFCAEKII